MANACSTQGNVISNSLINFNPEYWKDWYHDKASRSAADQIIKNKEAGTFLIRPSIRVPGDLVLTVSEPPKVKHYLITCRNDQKYFRIGDQVFTSMPELLTFYSRHRLDTSTLIYPIPLTSNHVSGSYKSSNNQQDTTFSSASSTSNSHSTYPSQHSGSSKSIHVIGIYDFDSKDPDDLPFKKGEKLEVITKQEEQWWTAKNAIGKTGHIPVPYIKVINELNKTNSLDNLVVPSDAESLDNFGQVYTVIMRRIPSAFSKEDLPLSVNDRVQLITKHVKNDITQGYGRNLTTGEEGLFPWTHVTLANNNQFLKF